MNRFKWTVLAIVLALPCLAVGASLSSQEDEPPQVEINATIKTADGKTWLVAFKGGVTLVDITPKNEEEPPPDDDEEPPEEPGDPPVGDLSDLPPGLQEILKTHPAITARNAEWTKLAKVLE